MGGGRNWADVPDWQRSMAYLDSPMIAYAMDKKAGIATPDMFYGRLKDQWGPNPANEAMNKPPASNIEPVNPITITPLNTSSAGEVGGDGAGSGTNKSNELNAKRKQSSYSNKRGAHSMSTSRGLQI